jgi:hypothetical protein
MVARCRGRRRLPRLGLSRPPEIRDPEYDPRGLSEPVAMSISGHRSVGVFRRYNITTIADQRRALLQTQEYVDARRVTTLARSKGPR